jgi:hypothetical protein
MSSARTERSDLKVATIDRGASLLYRVSTAQGSPRHQLFLRYRFRHSREPNFGQLTRAREVYIFLRPGCRRQSL